jgi:hypothetical protein
MLETLTRETFAPHVGETFRLHLSDQQSIDAALLEASVVGTPPPGSAVRAPFSLIFKGPAAPMLPQQIYRVEHATLGALDLFVVPIGPSQPKHGPGGMLYEVIFN